MKVLFVATVVKTHINTFHLPFLKMFKKMGWETAVCARDDFGEEECIIPHCDKFYDLPFERLPFKPANLSVYKELKKLIEEEKYDIIHCHTPVGGILARLAARKVRRNGTKVIYTAHGFHFYKGAPLINWLLYFPAEWLCSWLTDCLITINKEDYKRAKKYLHAKKIEYVPGVGIKIEKFKNRETNSCEKRRELGIPEGAVLLLSVGELNKNKNHEVILRAIAELNDQNIHYVIAGKGPNKHRLLQLSRELGLKDKVHLLGFRRDVADIYRASDIFCFPSKREGLGLAAIEAMASGMPIVTSNIHGICDYSINGETGFCCSPTNVYEFKEAILKLVEDSELRKEMGRHNANSVEKYSLETIKKEMKNIYENVTKKVLTE